MLNNRYLDIYRNERLSLSEKEIDTMLEKGRTWNLGKTLSSGGSLFFPHTYIRECGYQIAAAVHACLDSGADCIVVLGVLHALTTSLKAARKMEREGADISKLSCWGLFGPGLNCDPYWKEEFSLESFIFLFEHEVKRRKIKAPKLIVRFPNLVNREPEKLPGIEELEKLRPHSVFIATADLFHHGIAYGNPLQACMPIGEKTEAYVKEEIANGLKFLQTQNYKKYFDYCMRCVSDSLHVGPVLSYLLGPLSGKILDLKLVDVSDLFEGRPNPSWVAASLIELVQKRI